MDDMLSVVAPAAVAAWTDNPAPMPKLISNIGFVTVHYTDVCNNTRKWSAAVDVGSEGCGFSVPLPPTAIYLLRVRIDQGRFARPRYGDCPMCTEQHLALYDTNVWHMAGAWSFRVMRATTPRPFATLRFIVSSAARHIATHDDADHTAPI
jgi:hypothetical protein